MVGCNNDRGFEPLELEEPQEDPKKTRSLSGVREEDLDEYVLDMFTSTVDFTVHYGAKQVGNGCEVKPSATADRPKVQINAYWASNYLFTLVMVDPDAPSPSEPTLREWLHWIVVDVPGGSDVTKGRELIPYIGPKPPTGIHRYIFVLFK